MTQWTRRGFMLAGSATTLAACSNAIGLNKTRAQIDADVDRAREALFRTVPGARQLAERSAGMLIIPEVTKAGLMFGGAYGEGALMIGPAKVDYFSFTAASFGLQVGVQRYSHALFFLTQEMLADFRYSDGWQLGVDAQYTTPEDAGALGVTTTTINQPVIALVFGQKGLIIGATLEGAKYSRLIR